jgi:hypothetical protein
LTFHSLHRTDLGPKVTLPYFLCFVGGWSIDWLASSGFLKGIDHQVAGGSTCLLAAMRLAHLPLTHLPPSINDCQRLIDD